jgi:hypothetical protein
MQKARIRTGWKNKQRQISIEEFANALSAICWRISLNAAKNLHQQDFLYESDQQRIDVIQTYLRFFIHCADRLMFQSLDLTQRNTFITALSMDCRRHYIENAKELLGRTAISTSDENQFIEDLNDSTETLSNLQFLGDEPGFQMFRMLGTAIQEIMGNSQTNKWITDQVMEIDGQEAYEIFWKSFVKLKRASGY